MRCGLIFIVRKTGAGESGGRASQLVQTLRARLPKLAQLLATDLQAAIKNDPAASGYEEVLFSYPGVEAITVQRWRTNCTR